MNIEQTMSTHSQAHQPREQSLLIGKRVVVCEDEALTLMQLHRALERAGLVVVGAVTNGKDAVEVVLRERPDLVLMDVSMPVMDGLEAARHIFAEYQICMVMLTGFPDAVFKEQADKLGVSGYVNKPITSDVLIPILVEALAQYYAQ